jgi:pyridinium-3,5-biscarboxylic acid mononucleotide sulfurtransferase
MNQAETSPILKLNAVLESLGPVAVAVSGGVDSLTLAQAAHRHLGDSVEMIHATSAAVPAEATARTRALADANGWKLRIIDAGEFADENYLANPVNRCFFCKSALYGSLSKLTDRQVVSGANVDDLGDYRPGMEAAGNNDVRHPFIEAAIDKDGVRAVARFLGLDDVSELPASPCLSSRIETGIAVTPESLAFIHAVETRVGDWLSANGGFSGAVRCRVRATGTTVELDKSNLAMVLSEEAMGLRCEIDQMASENGFKAGVPFEPYRMGSAFLKDQAEKVSGR